MDSQTFDSVRSNAFNFGGFVAGGVDPRTGIYTLALTLGAIRSADLNGPSFNLALGFNPLNTRNAGYGTGWSLSTSRYDLRSKVITLASGETYKAAETAKALFFKEMKLESAKVLKTGIGRYEVRYKDGRREELEVFGATHIAVPMKIIAANGASIALKYALFNEQPMLVEISDAKRQLLTVSRTAGRLTLTQNPDTPDSAEFSMTFKNDRVTAIGLPVGRGWDIQYEVIDGISYVKRVESPLGAVENIRYKRLGHLQPVLGAVQGLPYVIAHDIFAKQGQPKVIKTYTYSDRNYLGHGVPPDSTDDGDPLYRAPGTYQYNSTEKLIVGHKLHTHTKRTYNKFHLLVSEVTTCNDAIVSTTTEYHCNVAKPFTEQVAQFRLPKSQTRTYENSKTKNKRTETSTTEFDAAGNLLRQVGGDGVVTQFEYYPGTESKDCPKDPLGFVRFLKQRAVTPAAGGGATTVTRYRYALHSAIEGASQANVVPIQESFFEWIDGSETLRSQVDLTYLNSPKDPARHGLLQQQSVTRNATTTRLDCSYVLDGTKLVLKKTVQGFDGKTSSSEQTLSILSGLVMCERDAEDTVIEYEYDKLGRRLLTRWDASVRFRKRIATTLIRKATSRCAMLTAPSMTRAAAKCRSSTVTGGTASCERSRRNFLTTTGVRSQKPGTAMGESFTVSLTRSAASSRVGRTAWARQLPPSMRSASRTALKCLISKTRAWANPFINMTAWAEPSVRPTRQATRHAMNMMCSTG